MVASCPSSRWARWLLALTLAAVAPLGAQSIPMTSANWRLTGQAEARAFAGREALVIRTGRADLEGIDFVSGTIEFDAWLTPWRSFAFVEFRTAGSDGGEEFYLRPHKTSLPDAVQYVPVRQGQGAWQLFHGPGGTTARAIPHGRWFHLRVDVSGERAALYLDDESTPTLVVARLAGPASHGGLGLRAFAPAGGAPDGIPVAAYSNFVVRPGTPAIPDAPSVAAPRGTITSWQLSPGWAATEANPATVPESLWAGRASWTAATSEPNGLLYLDRWVTRDRDADRMSVAARHVIHAERAGTRELQVGFSDRVVVLLNGRPLAGGDAHYVYDVPRQDVVIAPRQLRVFLPLEAGDNELVLLVTDEFGGWGAMGILDPVTG